MCEHEDEALADRPHEVVGEHTCLDSTLSAFALELTFVDCLSVACIPRAHPSIVGASPWWVLVHVCLSLRQIVDLEWSADDKTAVRLHAALLADRSVCTIFTEPNSNIHSVCILLLFDL